MRIEQVRRMAIAAMALMAAVAIVVALVVGCTSGGDADERRSLAQPPAVGAGFSDVDLVERVTPTW